MRYAEYFVPSLEKTLGVFGEVHIYTAKDSTYAMNIMPSFDNVAIEGTDKQTSLDWLIIPFAPVVLAYAAATNRSFSNDTAQTIAEKQGKKILRLEDDIDQTFSLSQKIAIAIKGLITIPFTPSLYIYLRINGDPYEFGTKAYQDMNAKRTGKKSLFSKLSEHGLQSNMDERDTVMAERSLDIFQNTPGNLLIVCGEQHFDGVVEKLHAKLDLTQTKIFP